ncbi:MAG: mechanosensitive ion channel [Rhodospirillaceae bacterium]|nr:mechanosensitive ion channel [Rhodospirillaceae bacterium]
MHLKCLFRRLCLAAVLVLLCQYDLAGSAAAQEQVNGSAAPKTEMQGTAVDDTDALIEALRDPDRRAELLRQLEILRAAQALGERRDAAPKEDKAGEGAPAVAVKDNSIAAAIANLTGNAAAVQPAQGAAETTVETSEGVEPGGALVALQEMVGGIRANLRESWQWLGELPAHLTHLEGNLETSKFRTFWAALSLELLVILAVAGLLSAGAHFILLRPSRRLLGRVKRVTHLIWRNALGVVLKLLPALLFGLSGYIMVIVYDLSETARLVAMAVINAQTAVLLMMAVSSLDLAVARGRIMPGWFTDEAATFLRAAILRLTIVLAYGVMTIELAGAMGVVEPLIRLIMHVVGIAIAIIALHAIRRLRHILALHELAEQTRETEALVSGASQGRVDSVADGASAMAARSLAKAEESMRRNWASYATIAVLSFYLLWLLAPVEVLIFCLRGAVLTVVVALLVRSLVRLIGRAFARDAAEVEKPARWSTGPWRRVRVYLDVLRRAVIALLCVLAGIFVLQIWGVDFLAWLTSPAGQGIAGSLMTIALLIIGGIVLSELFSIAVESHLQRRSADYADLSRRSRARTLLPLLRNVMRVTLGTIITLLVLGEIGVDIGPLLAAAGVVGLAVGFGAQTLVKDIITGIFILVEDTIAVGDVVDLEGNSGVVESMTIRTVRLRDQAGVVHSIPFSAITKVMNMTRDYSYAVFNIGIAYDQDIGKVMDVIRAVATELCKDPQLGRDILEPIDIQGVDQFADSAVIIKARLKTKPIRQWDVGRKFNWRLKEAFDAAGIEIPFPQRTMHIVGPKKETAIEALSGAATAESSGKAP